MAKRSSVLGTALALTLAVSAGPSFGVSGTQSPVSEPGLGIRLVDAPVERRKDPRASVSVVDHVAPGTTISRRYEVVNDTARDLQIKTYVGSADIGAGDFVGQADAGSGDLTAWSSTDPALLQMSPRERATGRVTITVPADAAPGERYGVIWAESPKPAGSGVAQVTRIGVRIYLSVGPGNEPASDFVVDALQAGREDGMPLVNAEVRNVGGRALDMSGELRLTDGPGGLSAGPFEARLGTTLKPGDEAPVRVELDKALPAGPWTATLTLTSGLLERRAEAAITFPAADTAASPVPVVTLADPEAEVRLPLAAVVGIGFLVLFLIALGALLVVRRRGRVLRGREWQYGEPPSA